MDAEARTLVSRWQDHLCRRRSRLAWALATLAVAAVWPSGPAGAIEPISPGDARGGLGLRLGAITGFDGEAEQECVADGILQGRCKSAVVREPSDAESGIAGLVGLDIFLPRGGRNYRAGLLLDYLYGLEIRGTDGLVFSGSGIAVGAYVDKQIEVTGQWFASLRLGADLQVLSSDDATTSDMRGQFLNDTSLCHAEASSETTCSFGKRAALGIGAFATIGAKKHMSMFDVRFDFSVRAGLGKASIVKIASTGEQDGELSAGRDWSTIEGLLVAGIEYVGARSYLADKPPAGAANATSLGRERRALLRKDEGANQTAAVLSPEPDKSAEPRKVVTERISVKEYKMVVQLPPDRADSVNKCYAGAPCAKLRILVRTCPGTRRVEYFRDGPKKSGPAEITGACSSAFSPAVGLHVGVQADHSQASANCTTDKLGDCALHSTFIMRMVRTVGRLTAHFDGQVVRTTANEARQLMDLSKILYDMARSGGRVETCDELAATFNKTSKSGDAYYISEQAKKFLAVCPAHRLATKVAKVGQAALKRRCNATAKALSGVKDSADTKTTIEQAQRFLKDCQSHRGAGKISELLRRLETRRHARASAEAKARTGQLMKIAVGCIRPIVKSRLNDPDSAVITPLNLVDKVADKYLFFAEVRAKNRFGGYVRKNWVVSLRIDPTGRCFPHPGRFGGLSVNMTEPFREDPFSGCSRSIFDAKSQYINVFRHDCGRWKRGRK